MSTFFTRFVSAIAMLAFVATLVPAAAFAEDTSVNPAPAPTEEATSTDAVAPDTTTPDAPAFATFELPPLVSDGGEFDAMNTGSVNGQNGWSATGPFDQGIVANTTGNTAFGTKVFRLSNAVASGSFGDQVFSAPLANAVGEPAATAAGFSEGTRNNHFEMAFDFMSAVPTAEQPDLAVTLSPDRGDGSRMSYLKLADTPTGIDVIFYDVQGTTNPANFVPTTVATGLDRSMAHNVKLTMDTVTGPSNDVVNVYVDGTLVHTGTTWENYYRNDSEASAEQSPRIVKSVLFRENAAAPATSGKGFFFDHLTLTSSRVAANDAVTTKIVRAADLETATTTASTNGSGKWFFYNDETDQINNGLGSFTASPTPNATGAGAVEVAVSGTQRSNLATYAFAGTKLANITTLKYDTYNPSEGNGAGASAKRAGFLQFNVSFNGVDSWQRRLTYVPANNVTSIAQDSWKTWDAIDNGNAKWTYSGATWPNTTDAGTTPKTWSQILSLYPNAQIRSTDAFFGIRVGEPYADGYTELLDNVTVGINGVATTYDFETDAPTTSPTQSSGGGSGGHRSSSSSSSSSASGSTDSSGGQVLGAATFNFTINLGLGARGNDVIELQKVLIAGGYLHIVSPTGWFGPLTLQAVKEYQLSHGIITTGFVGPLTRAQLNLGENGSGQ